MSAFGQSTPLYAAQAAADALCQLLRPVCVRIEVAGEDDQVAPLARIGERAASRSTPPKKPTSSARSTCPRGSRTCERQVASSNTWKDSAMLVLSRKDGEGVQIADNIRVVVHSRGDGRIKLAIEAPRDLKILRTEIADAIAREAETIRPAAAG
ncbi:MAG: carbon storage regulator [Planctomycetaceae bacterium]